MRACLATAAAAVEGVVAWTHDGRLGTIAGIEALLFGALAAMWFWCWRDERKWEGWKLPGPWAW